MLRLSYQEQEKVEALIRHVGDECIFPYFNALKLSDIAYKASQTDPVSVADKKAESLLHQGLLDILPDSLFVGEELYARDKSILKHLTQTEKPVWVVDPIDGTDNFINGEPNFGIMVCLINKGDFVASWLYEVVSKRITSYRAPFEVYENGKPLIYDEHGSKPFKGLIGKKLHRFPEIRNLARTSADILVKPIQEPSIISYRKMLLGNADFLIYKVTYPWDHLPGLALLSTRGALSCRWDGKPFEFLDIHKGLVVAKNQAALNCALKEIVAPLLKSKEIAMMQSFE